ncbi:MULTISPECIES: hypothetical protein [unclassified Ensifer]|uniref:hypothetical protein n=1 Tax=unclassified Ensifer TaxID=2633371 RepID=UPI00081801DB|nr:MULTISPECIES: hypothetical protein [unclassified Ensifer]OCP22496.1 hypothetical protein BC363_27050 [Ensifer sp. LC384]
MITTISNAEAVSSLIAGLAPHGRLVLLGAGKDPLPLSAECSLVESITDTPDENEWTLDFSVLTGVCEIETVPLEEASAAYQTMKSSDGKFRMVLTMKETLDAY